MRIIAGAWRGPRFGGAARPRNPPTADRVRQALFDRLMHAPWAGRAVIDGATVLDGFAGTGALGLEALSRGAAKAVFIENDRAALTALRQNIVACRAEDRCLVHAADIRKPPKGEPCRLVFLDPPYHQGLVQPAIDALQATGWIQPGTIIMIESGIDEPPPDVGTLLATFTAGAAKIHIQDY